MEEILREINPYLDIRADCVRVTEDNLRALFSGEDYICEAFDRAEQKAMLVNGVLTGLPGKILVSGSGMAGYGGGNDIKTRKLTECFYLCGDGVTEAGPDAGLTAARVALCAAHQANVVIERIILGKPGGQTETM